MEKGEEESHHDQCVQTCPQAMAAELEGMIGDALVLEFEGAIQKLQERVARKLPQNASEQEQRQNNNSLDVQYGLLARFLFSCLVDADRTERVEFEDQECKKLRARIPSRPWDVLVPRLEAALAEKRSQRPMDVLRREIADHCARRAADEQGIFTLTAPTGGGKTLASLRFALLHAQKHHLDRVIYVGASHSGIEQCADEARTLLEQGEAPGSVVLEHHLSLFPDADTDSEDTVKLWETLAENWDAPVVFTTMAEFLGSLFDSGTRHVHRMHNLAHSVLVFDAAETLPARFVRLFCNAVEFLVGQCGASVVLCGFTRSHLGDLLDPLLGSLALGPDREIVSDDVSRRIAALHRAVFFNHCQKSLRAEDVAALAQEELDRSGSCLVVCNTTEMAERLLGLCPAREGSGRYALSPNLCPVHRLESLQSMRKDLDEGKPVLCISTQRIECGMDISFHSVIRLAAGLDSILQAAGRCNRHGEGEPGRVHVVRVDAKEEELACLPDSKDRRDVFWDVVRREYADTLDASGVDLSQPQFVDAYFDSFYSRAGNGLSFAVGENGNTLLDMFGSNRFAVREGSRFPFLGQSFATASGYFADMDAAAVPLVVPFGEGEKIIEDLCVAQTLSQKKLLLRKAQRYLVRIGQDMRKLLMQNDAVYQLQDSGILALRKDFYSPAIGVVARRS